MVDNILFLIKNINSSKKVEALIELRSLLEKVEIGIESISVRDTEWDYTTQLEGIKKSLGDVNTIINE